MKSAWNTGSECQKEYKNLANPAMGVLYREFYVLRYPHKIGAWGFERDHDGIYGWWNSKNYCLIFVWNRNHVRDSIFNDCPVLDIKVSR